MDLVETSYVSNDIDSILLRIITLLLGILHQFSGMVGWCEGVVYLMSPGRPTDIGLQFGKACYPCSR